MNDFHIYLGKIQRSSIMKEKTTADYDLIIVGAGCMGAAMAYHARKNGKTAVILEKGDLANNDTRYWSSSFSARQNRVQYTESYLTRYVLESNNYWDQIEAEANSSLKKGTSKIFRHKEGALWFGDKDVTTSEGNIYDSNYILEQENVDRLYMLSLIPNHPQFFRNFKFGSTAEEKEIWQNWAALFQQDGGSINMKESYEYFYDYATTSTYVTTGQAVQVHDKVSNMAYLKEDGKNKFTFDEGVERKTVSGEKVFIAVGIQTPTFMNDVMNAGDHLIEESTIQEYVASYFQIDKESNYPKFEEDLFPNWIQFLDEEYEMGYGFPHHDWDQPEPTTRNNAIKIGTMANDPITVEAIRKNKVKFGAVPSTDHRVKAAESYVQKYMQNLKPTSYNNQTCPIVFYNNRQTLLDFANRTKKDIVVQNGGWIAKYYPLLARTAYDMLFNPERLYGVPNKMKYDVQYSVLRKFINRTTYPIRNQVLNYLDDQTTPENSYDTVIVGAGCSGLYSAYRLNSESATSSLKIGIFDMLDRISGRLWTIKFEGASTVMELGGMRYIQNNHKLLAHYIQKLEIPEMQFRMQGSTAQENSLRCYLRNDRYRQNEWQQLQNSGQKLHTVYRIQGEIVGMTAFQMISYSLYLMFTYSGNQDGALQDLNDLKNDQTYWQSRVTKKSQFDYLIEFELEDWNYLKPKLVYKPKTSTNHYPMYKFGFQNVIEDQFSHEAYNFIAEQNGYYSNTSNASYLEQSMVYVLDFGNVNYKTLEGGFDMFNYSLANHILDPNNGIGRNGGGLFLEHELVNIEWDAANSEHILKFNNKGNEVTVKAKKLILGMPKRSVEILSSKIPYLQTDIDYRKNQGVILPTSVKPNKLSQLIQSTQNMPAIKIIMNFSQNWWDPSKINPDEFRSHENMTGVSVTDLPIRQTLYFGTNEDNMLLASYNDMITTEYWSTLQEHFPDYNPNLVNKKKCYKIPNKLVREKNGNIAPASEMIVNQVCHQLSLVHGKSVSPNLVREAMYQNWGQDPFGGGYHNWYSGYDVEAVMYTMRKPWSNRNIFIVGEAFSNLTGWVEGALQTAEQMLISEYGLPESISGYYLGY